jgi:hypothetical protein
MNTTPDAPIILLGRQNLVSEQVGDDPPMIRVVGPPGARFLVPDDADTYGAIIIDTSEPFMWPTLDDLENPTSTAQERHAVDVALGLAPGPPLELVPRPTTTIGFNDPQAIKRWSATMFADVARAGYFLGKLAAKPRSPDLWEKPTPPRTWRERVGDAWRKVRSQWRGFAHWWRYERTWPYFKQAGRDDE